MINPTAYPLTIARRNPLKKLSNYMAEALLFYFALFLCNQRREFDGKR
jgi:hypothetical protein